MKELNLLERSIIAPFINEEDKETIAVYPGAFKPPHRGHLSVVEKANAVADKTIVVISQADRDGFTAEDSLKIWEIYTKDMPNVEVRIASKPSPVSEAYSLFRHNPEKNYVMALGKNEFSRVGHLDRYHNAKPFDAGTLEDLSSTNLRQAIRENDNDTIQNFLPEGVNLEEYLGVFNQAPVNEVSTEEYIEHLENIRNDFYNRGLKDKAAKVQADIDKLIKKDKIEEEEGKMPSQDQVDKFFSLTQNEMHYLNQKPVAGQKGSRTHREIEPWDEYDLSNFNALVRKAKKTGKIQEEIDGLENAKIRLSDRPYKILDIEYKKTRRGEKFIKITYEQEHVPGKMYWSRPQFVNILYDTDEELEYIKKELKLPVEEINEDHYPENFLQDSITSFVQYMEDSGMQIAPPPRVEFVNDDVENAENLLGKTAYYNPEENVIVLYTLGRHPKDILRSFAHEMIHHIQNLEGRLGGINTTNTNEDDYLDQIEREAYEHGNMTFRNWTDSLLNGDNLNENEEGNFENELESFAKQLGSEIEDEIEEKGGLKEAIGIVGIIGWMLLSNTVANMLSKFAKNQFEKYDFGKGEAAAKKIYDFTHKNEEAFKAPIKRIVGLFTKNEKYKKQISDVLYAILIFMMAGQAGGDAVSYIKKAGYLKGGIYALKSLVKGKEVHTLIKGVIEDL